MLTISKSAIDYIVANSAETFVYYCRMAERVKTESISNLLNGLLEITSHGDKYHINIKNIVAVRNLNNKRMTIYFASSDYIMIDECPPDALNIILKQVS